MLLTVDSETHFLFFKTKKFSKHKYLLVFLFSHTYKRTLFESLGLLVWRLGTGIDFYPFLNKTRASSSFYPPLQRSCSTKTFLQCPQKLITLSDLPVNLTPMSMPLPTIKIMTVLIKLSMIKFESELVLFLPYCFNKNPTCLRLPRVFPLSADLILKRVTWSLYRWNGARCQSSSVFQASV